MSHSDKIKENIKKDLLKNIDKVVNNIYESLNNLSFANNLEDASFVIEGNPYKKLTLADDLTGKTICPLPLAKANGEENYLEVAIDEISRKIKLSEQIFTHLYKFRYKNGMLRKEIPAAILDILEVYEIHHGFIKNKNANLKSTSKWLLGIALFGSMRYQNKTNNPYITSKEAKIIVKGFIKNLKNIYSIIEGKYLMIDENNVGIALFDCLHEEIKCTKIE